MTKKTNYTTSIYPTNTTELAIRKKIAQLQLISILHSSLLTKQPDYLYRLISLHTAPRHLRSSNYTVLTEPSYRRKKLGKRRYFVCASHLWNQLPPSLKTINTSSATFKYKQKKYLIVHDIWTWNIFVFDTLYTCLYLLIHLFIVFYILLSYYKNVIIELVFT